MSGYELGTPGFPEDISTPNCGVLPPVHPLKVDWPFGGFFRLRACARKLAKQAKASPASFHKEIVEIPLRYRRGRYASSSQREEELRRLLESPFARRGLRWGGGRLEPRAEAETPRYHAAYAVVTIWWGR